MPISIQQISYIHPDKEVLFSDLNFAISKGQKLGLVGNNGCGKSTLLQIIAGQLSPSSGVIVRPSATRNISIMCLNISGNMIR